MAVDANDDKNKAIAAAYDVKGFPTLKVWNKKFGAGMSEYNSGRTADAIVEFMKKENTPTVSEVTSLSAITGTKPSFLLVGNPNDFETVSKVASEKKAYLNFYWIATLEGQTAGSVLIVENGAVKDTLAAGGDLTAFIQANAYPVVGQLTPEN